MSDLAESHDDDDDMACLRAYVRDGSEGAFAALVRRRIDLVYSAAVRQLDGDRALAEDVAQSVFVVLARKAPALVRDGGGGQGVLLSAWLLRATRLTALDARKRLARRRKHERRAAEMERRRRTDEQPDPHAHDLTWGDVRPLLDEQLDALRDAERRAIVLRYFEGHSVREVADALGVSEDAAKQRLWRALEKLRARFAARGVSVSAAALGPALAAHAVGAAPVALADAAAKLALAAAATSAKAALPLSAKGALRIMAWTKAKIAATAAVAAMVVGAGTTAMVVANRSTKDEAVVVPKGAAMPQPAPMAVPSAPTKPMTADQRRRFNEAYALASGQTLKRVAPPFPPERLAYFDSIDAQHMFDHADTKGLYAFTWTGSEAQWRQWNGGATTLGATLRALMKIPSYRLDLSDADRARPVGGDWVTRDGSTTEEQLADLSRVLASDLSWPVHFEQRVAPRPVHVAKGTYAYKPAPSVDAKHAFPNSIELHLYLGDTVAKRGNSTSIGDLGDFLMALGETVNREVVLDPADAYGVPPKLTIVWINHLSGPVPAAKVPELLSHVGEQIGLTFTDGQRDLPHWVLVPNDR